MIVFVDSKDKRDLYAYEEIKNLYPVCFSNLKGEIEKAKILIFSINGVDCNGLIKGSNLNILNLDLKKLEVIITYKANAFLKEFSDKRSIKLFELANLPYLVEGNSYLTAEGLLSIIISKTNYSIFNKKILIIGYGNSGKQIANLLKNFSSEIYLFTSQNINSFKKVDSLDDLYSFDIIINTAPVTLLTERNLECLEDTIIFDISSSPYGVDFDYALKKGIKAYLEPQIPGRLMEVSAGKLMGRGCNSYLCKLLY